MFPLLNEAYVIKGTSSTPCLVSLRESKQFQLNDILIAKVISECTGHVSLEDISAKHKISAECLLNFFEQFKNAGLVSFTEREATRSLPMNLGRDNPWLKEVHLDITDKCNLARFCKHCFRGDKLNQNQERSFAEWEPVLDNLEKNGVYKIALSGGEVFLHDELNRIVEGIISRNMFCAAFFSNGTIHNDQVIKVFRSLHDARMKTAFYISLDGFDSETNDIQRGAGSFKKTLKFIEMVREMGFPITINSQVNRMNFLGLLKWYELLRETGITRWRLTSGRLTGRLKENSYLYPPLEKLFQEYEKLLTLHCSVLANDPKTMHLSLEGFFRTEMLISKKALVFDPDISICDYKKNAISIEPNGNVQFCTSWGGQHFGNVFQSDISDIWHSRQLQELKNMPIGNIEGCKDCEFLRFCGGGCRLIAETVRDKDESACKIYQYYTDVIFPILQKQKVAFSVK